MPSEQLSLSLEPDKEKWRAVVGYEGFYEVSNLGHVRSLDRAFTDTMGRRQPRKGQLLKPGPRSSDHRPAVNLSVNGCTEHHNISVLVLAAFVGPRPPGLFACHNDGNPFNNVISNLRWDTPKGNMEDRRQHGTYLFGATHPLARLTELDVLDIRARHAAGAASYANLAKQYGVTKENIYRIVRRLSWRHLP